MQDTFSLLICCAQEAQFQIGHPQPFWGLLEDVLDPIGGHFGFSRKYSVVGVELVFL